MVLAGTAAVYGIDYWRVQTSPEYKVEQGLKELEKRYEEDPYGGDTPEETLRLFVEALKKGDTDLAAKYFVLDKQEQWRGDLSKIKEKGLLGEMVKELELTKLTKKTLEEAFFTLVNENNVAEAELVIAKNLHSGKWKIYEL